MSRKHRKSPTRRAAIEAVRRAPLDPDFPIDHEVPIDDDLVEALKDTQTLAEDEPRDRRLVGETPVDRVRARVLAGGDVDALADEVGSGEEAVGGSAPTPDQDRVDDLGRAAGISYADDEPLRPEEKVGDRDDDRWELDPASAEDYQDRQRPERQPTRRRR